MSEVETTEVVFIVTPNAVAQMLEERGLLPSDWGIRYTKLHEHSRGLVLSVLIPKYREVGMKPVPEDSTKFGGGRGIGNS